MIPDEVAPLLVEKPVAFRATPSLEPHPRPLPTATPLLAVASQPDPKSAHVESAKAGAPNAQNTTVTTALAMCFVRIEFISNFSTGGATTAFSHRTA
jgi:hypothetical protein